MSVKHNQLIFQCPECKKNYKKDFNKESIKRFANTYEFCNGNIHKFILLLRKGVYSYEYQDSWERFNETSLPGKKDFYSELSSEDITDKDYTHAQKVFQELKLKILGDYYDLYVQSDTLLLANTRLLKYMNLTLLIFWQACLKKTRVELELLTDTDML